MVEYIEREAAKRAIMSQYLNRANKTKYADVIDAVPAADVVPVVRCRDCKHRDPEDRKCDYGGLEHAHMFPVADDWFCADGEKREVEHD